MANYRAIDFFCGAGGMTCGLREAGIEVIAGVDFDPQCKDTYEANNKGSKFVEANIKELPSDYFEKEFSVAKDDDNLIMIGCSPCQYYSIINTSKNKSKESKDLLIDFQKFIEYYKPGYVLVENVPGIVTNKESVLSKFKDFLESESMGYKVEYRIINMCDYGIPQTRKRFSLIANRVGKDIIFPKKDDKKAIVSDFIGVKNGFPKIPAGHKDDSEFQHSVSKLSEISLRRLQKTQHNGGSRLSWKDDSELQLKCFVGKDDIFKDTFGRMWWDKPAPTITTKFFSVSNGRFAHPDEDRAISLREGATLQTFDKNYVFKAKSITVNARLIGNAVPPEYARRLGEIIVKEGK